MYTFVCVSTRPTLITTVCVKRYARAPASLSLSFFCIDTPPPWSDDNLNSARAHTPSVCVCVRGCASCIDVTLFYYYYTLRKEYTQREPITKHLAHLLTHHLDLLCIANVIPLSLSLILSLSLSCVRV